MRALPSLLFCIAILASRSSLAFGSPLRADPRIHDDERGETSSPSRNMRMGTREAVVCRA